MIDQLHPALAHHVVNSLGWRTLRPLQGEAIEPLLAGHDAVLLAPTAGGKTEAAMFPLLTAMERERWTGVSVLYICPLKALTAVFTAPPQFTVVEGHREIGRVDPSLLTDRVEGPRLLLLAGRSWRVTWIDWRQRRCFVEPGDRGGRARWVVGGREGRSFALTRSIRDVLLGDDPPVPMTERARTVLVKLRSSELPTVHPGGLVIAHAGSDVRWWTWAGFRANSTLAATLSELVDGAARIDDVSIRLRNDLTLGMWRTATVDAADRMCLAEVDDAAVDGLKFSEALPRRLAVATLAARLTDLGSARTVLNEAIRFVHR